MRTGLIIFLFLALFGDFIANDRPLFCQINGKVYFPSLHQKGFEWNLVRADSLYSTRDWQTFDGYERVLKSPVPFSAGSTDISGARYVPPFQNSHLLGTDGLGRDVLAGLIEGCSVAFRTGIFSMLLAVFLGILMGATAGFLGSVNDYLIMSLIEIKRAVPSILWIFALTAIIDQCTLTHIVLIIGLLSWPNIALLMRSSVLRVKKADYVMAARDLGFSKWRILFFHIIPNCLGPVYVAAAALVPTAAITESALTFLGIGLPLNTVTWGSMLRQAQSDISMWWLALFPGICLFLLILLFNTFAERLRKTNHQN